MDDDHGIQKLKDEWFVELCKRQAVMIVKADYGWSVWQWHPDGVGPPSEYDTPHEATARAAQLLGIKEPITPQNWPEEVCIGFIEKSSDKDR